MPSRQGVTVLRVGVGHFSRLWCTLGALELGHLHLRSVQGRTIRVERRGESLRGLSQREGVAMELDAPGHRMA